MDRIGRLVWLKRRHLRTSVGFWSSSLGVDFVERPDLIDRIYRCYLVVILIGWAFMSWSSLRAFVESAALAAGSSALIALAVLPLAAPWATLFLSSAAALRHAPLGLIDADVSFVVSGGFSMRSVAVVDVSASCGIAVAAGFLCGFMLGFGLEAAGAAISAGGLACALALAEAAAVALGRSVGCGRLSLVRADVAHPLIRRAVYSLAVALAEIGLAWTAAALVGAICPDTALRALCAPVGVAALSALLALAAAVLYASAGTIDAMSAIEESGLYAALFGVRRLVWLDRSAYHDICQRQHIARRRFRPSIPLGRGPAAPLSRALMAYLRQYESIGRLALVGAIQVPLSAVVLTQGAPPPLLFAWGLQLFYASTLIRDLGMAFRGDMSVSLVRDGLPFSNAGLALLDAIPPALFTFVLALSELALLAVVAPGFGSLSALAVSALLIVAFAMFAAFDAVEVAFWRVRMSSLVGAVVIAAVSGILSLAGPSALAGGLAVFDVLVAILFWRRAV